jgi:hypothetical protein
MIDCSEQAKGSRPSAELLPVVVENALDATP